MRALTQNPGKQFLLTFWLPALALVQAFFLALAWRSYPHYSMFQHEISDLGDPVHNPAGWWFWSLAMGFAGLMLWPVTAHMTLQVEELTAGCPPWRRKLVRMGSAASHFACWGLIALAFIPQYRALDAVHQVAGVFAFGGLYLAVLFFWCVPLWGTPLGLMKTVLSTFAACWGPVGFIVTQGYRFFAYGEVGDEIKARHQSLLLRFSLWEWLLFLGLLISLALLVSLLPNPSHRAHRANGPRG